MSLLDPYEALTLRDALAIACIPAVMDDLRHRSVADITQALGIRPRDYDHLRHSAHFLTKQCYARADALLAVHATPNRPNTAP